MLILHLLYSHHKRLLLYYLYLKFLQPSYISPCKAYSLNLMIIIKCNLVNIILFFVSLLCNLYCKYNCNLVRLFLIFVIYKMLNFNFTIIVFNPIKHFIFIYKCLTVVIVKQENHLFLQASALYNVLFQ